MINMIKYMKKATPKIISIAFGIAVLAGAGVIT